MKIKWTPDTHRPAVDTSAYSKMFRFDITGWNSVFNLKITIKTPGCTSVGLVVNEIFSDQKRAKKYAQMFVNETAKSLKELA